MVEALHAAIQWLSRALLSATPVIDTVMSPVRRAAANSCMWGVKKVGNAMPNDTGSHQHRQESGWGGQCKLSVLLTLLKYWHSP